MLDVLRQILIFSVPLLLLLTVVVAIHEGGHFLMAKWCRVAIDSFSIGFGKAIFKWTDKAGVEWKIGWIPLGGYVRFSGDTNEASVPDTDDLEEMRKHVIEKLGPEKGNEALNKLYAFKPVWQRALIAAAGPAANFILALAIFFSIFMFLDTGRTRPVVGEVMKGSPAEAAGFMPGDLIKEVNGREMRDFSDFVVYVSLRAGDQLNVKVDRAGEELLLTPTLRRIQEKDQLTGAKVKRGQIGIRSDPNAIYFYRAKNPIEALDEAGRAVWMRLETTLTYFGRIFQGRENGDQLSGVVGMAGVTGAVTKATISESNGSVGTFLTAFFFRMIQITASISIAVGFVNLLPVPVLDGGHLAFYAYEAAFRRPMAAKVQAASFKVGLALVLALMLFATWNDLQRYDAFRFIGGLIS